MWPMSHVCVWTFKEKVIFGWNTYLCEGYFVLFFTLLFIHNDAQPLGTETNSLGDKSKYKVMQ